jgi:hypothetical protein
MYDTSKLIKMTFKKEGWLGVVVKQRQEGQGLRLDRGKLA